MQEAPLGGEQKQPEGFNPRQDPTREGWEQSSGSISTLAAHQNHLKSFKKKKKKEKKKDKPSSYPDPLK